MSLQIGNAFQTIIGKDGTPLDSGFVYIGESGQNAENYPVPIFYDEDLTIPAPQPLRTINGYFSRNGSPAKIFISSSSCSITVRDKLKNLQWIDLGYTGVLNQEIQDEIKRGIANRYDAALTYNVGDIVLLNNGMQVISTIPNNNNDPNITMSGWVYIAAKKVESIDSVSDLRQYKKLLLPQMIALSDGTFWNTASSGIDDGTMTVVANDGTIWKRGRAGSLKLRSFGTTDNAADAFAKLFAFVNTLPSGYSDNGQGIRVLDVDLEGYVWETSTPIFGVQGIGGLNFINGHIKAKADFVGDYLVEFTDAVALRAYHYITWNHVIFDANRVTSCARFNRLLKCGVTGCHFIRWKDTIGYGLVVGKLSTDTLGAAAEAHEFFVNGQCSFAQYDFSQRAGGQVCSGTALYINTYDGHYSDFFIAGSGKGIVHDKCGLNIFENIHIYGLNEQDYGFYADCTGVNPFINLVNLYFDGCSARFLNPNQINMTACKIFRNDPTTTGLIIFDTSTSTNYPKRCNFIGNHFNTSYSGGKPQIQWVTSGGGTWSSTPVQDIVSHSNTNLGFVGLYDTGYGGQTSWYKWNGFSLVPRYLMDVGGSAVTTLTFDVSPYHSKNRGQNLSATVSEWMIAANWQATSGTGVGAYKVLVFHMSNGNYYGLFTAVGTTGFNNVPTISTAGVISVDLAAFYRGAIYRVDDRNYLPIVT